MAEQPSSASISGGSCKSSVVNHLGSNSVGANTTHEAALQPPLQGPNNSSEGAVEQSSAVHSLSHNPPTQPKGGNVNSRKRGHRENSREDLGGKRSRASNSPSASRRNSRVGAALPRGRPSNTNKAPVVEVRSRIRPQIKANPIPPLSTIKSTVDTNKAESSSSSGSNSVAQARQSAAEANRNNVRLRRAVTVASTAATASAVATAAAAAAARGKTHQRGRPSTKNISWSISAVTPGQSLIKTRGPTRDSFNSILIAPVIDTNQPQRRKYPLRNQVRVIPGRDEPVPLEVPPARPDYYPHYYRRSLPVSPRQSTNRPRPSLSALPTAPRYSTTARQNNSPVLSLRRSSRSKVTTGSCASSSGRRTSRGGSKLPLASTSSASSSAAPGPSSSSVSNTGPVHLPSTASVIVSSIGMAADEVNWEGLAEASAVAAAASSSIPPPPLLSASSSSAAASALPSSTSLLAAAMASSGGAGDSESDDSEVGLSCTSTSMLLQPNSSSAASSSQLLARTASSVGRLQALLEARGLPPHLFGALGPRMQHLLHRSIGGSSSGNNSGTSSKVQQLLQGLTSTGDEGAQLTAVIEMCQMLVMGNEDTLAGFPVKQVVPALINLLSMEHNFDMMNHACRALTYMMEALPRSSAVVVDAVPVFLEKLQVIQCMDVAEQSLTALEMLSRRHGKAILQARGVSSCLTYLDFFSIIAQRAALATTANCCLNLNSDEFHLVSESLPLLASRLTQQDKRSMESVCLAFSRLVDSFQVDPVRLRALASEELLANLQRLLVVSPQVISTGTFITVLRMLSIMCANCPSLSQDLLRHNVAETLLFLLTGNATTVSNQEEVELVSRSPQELYEITCLIAELMPRLPTDGLFSVDGLLERPAPVAQDTISWQWRDDRELWHPYMPMDSRIIEAAHQAGEDEISLSTLGRTYTIDFHSMQQINEDTGTTRPVQRRVLPSGGSRSSLNCTSDQQTVVKVEVDPDEEKRLADIFIRSLFSVLYEVYSSSAGPAVRCKCLKALLRMVHFASSDLLKEVLKNQVVSSHLAGMLASQDLRIVVGALQMAYLLMEKLPTEFSVHFRREGVMHQIQRLAETPLPQTPGPSSSQNSPANGALPLPQIPSSSTVARSLISFDNPAQDTDERSSSPHHVRLLAELKRKRSNPKRGPVSSRKTRQDDSASSNSSSVKEFLKVGSSFGASSSSRSGTPTASSSNSNNPFQQSTTRSRFSGAKSSFLASLNPVRWGRNTSVGAAAAAAAAATSAVNGQVPEVRHKWWRLTPETCLSKSNSTGALAAGNKEKARQWVREQAQRFVDLYFNSDTNDSQNPALNVLSSLTQAIDKLRNEPWQGERALCELREIVLVSDISPFEVNHSGLISALTQYLTTEISPNTEAANNNNDETQKNIADNKAPVLLKREQKLRLFLHIFAGCPRDSNWLDLPEAPTTEKTAAFSALVAKLGGCVAQLEQFPVKVHDFPSGTSGSGRGGSTSALKFFNTHQLKCNLQRHPSCNSLRQWKGGTVKIDPLALVQAIERYLVVRGYGRVREKESADSDDETEEDIDESLATMVINQGSARHKLQFLIGDQPLPYNMTVYQAIRQFGANAHAAATSTDQSETDTDSEAPLAHAGIWVQTHTIYYRPAPEDDAASSCVTAHVSSSCHHSGRKGKGSSTKSNSRRKAASADVQLRPATSPLLPFLHSKLPDNVTVQDPSLDVLCLLRILHALNRHWTFLYALPYHRTLLPQQEFLSSKVSAKASRQLQDPLVIMTGNLPAWLQQIATACPFLFPFETRQLLFYAVSFDRDRALQRLLETSPELNSAEAHERVTPRLDKRKRVVSRNDILRQAEQVVQDLATSKALLEVQYENEVGTGLGPTLEFYALVSRELQRADLELWMGESVASEVDGETRYVHSTVGLFPSPIAKSTKQIQAAKVKAKFKFLGRFMAKAVMDSRMLDVPLSSAFYKTLLSENSMLTLADLSYVSPAVHATLSKLVPLARKYSSIEADPLLSFTQKAELQEALTLDGAPVSAIELDFTLPGYPNVELRKGGKDIQVTIHNLDSYINLVCHWFLYEGCVKQVESLREGFEGVFPINHLRLFYPEELEAVFCGSSSRSSWDVRYLMECCRIDHGFTPDSRAVRFLFDILSNYNSEEQRKFIQFITGSPNLPVGGFKSLNPPFTVVRKTLEQNMDPDDFLPSVMTCVNYLKLPDYSSIEVMREKLRIATQEGQHSFHLS